MQVVVPFDADAPKSRLGSVLDGDERVELSRAMLYDVLDAIAGFARRGPVDVEPLVLSTGPVEWTGVTTVERKGGGAESAVEDVPVEIDHRPLTEAVNAALAESDGPVAIVMADLALATPDALERLFAAEGDVVIAPGRGGGTNALVVRDDDFRVDYHGASFRDHRGIADALGADVTVVDSYRLSTDVDEPADLVEVLLHGEGRAASWLDAAGFRLVEREGRVSVARE